MKVLILHQHFKTPSEGGALRSYFLAKALVAHGHQAIVITGGGKGRYDKSDIEGIEVYRTGVQYDNSFDFWRRSRSFLQYAWKSVTLSTKLEGIDLCYAISVPLTVGLSARWLKSKCKIPYIFEVGDLWPDAPIQMGYVRSYLFRQLLFGMERSIYRDSQAIVALSPSIKSAIEKKVPGKTVHMIPNMADTEFFLQEPKHPGLISQYKVEGKFVVSYIGAVGVANGLDYFIECARASEKAQLPVHFLLCGEGALLESHKRNATRLDLSNLTFIPFQDRDGVRDIMNVTDAIFVCYKSYPILETGSPNKYFDGLAAGKLILINFGGWIKHEIETQRCGVYLNKQQPSDFVRTVQSFISDPALLIDHQTSARKLAISKYDRKMLSAQFLDIVVKGAEHAKVT